MGTPLAACVFLTTTVVSAQDLTATSTPPAAAAAQATQAETTAVSTENAPLAEATTADWRLVENGVAAGPYAAEEIRSKIAAGLVTGDQLVWKAGMAEWQPIKTVAPFDAAFNAPPVPADMPPVPPVQPLTPPTTDATTVEAQSTVPRSGGWAMAGAILGYSMSALILGTGAAAAAIYETDTSVPLGATAWSTNLVFGPVVFAAGASARHRGGVRGSLGIRVSAWVFYGIAVGIGAAEIGLGASGEDVPIGAVIPAIITTFTSQILFSTDALVSAIQVRHANAAVKTPASHSRILLRPILAPTAAAAYGSGGIMGLAGSFF